MICLDCILIILDMKSKGNKEKVCATSLADIRNHEPYASWLGRKFYFIKKYKKPPLFILE